MDYFQDAQGNIVGYAPGTPKDKMRKGLTPLSDTELDTVKEQQMSMQDLANKLVANINAEYEKRTLLVVESYPLHERESWPIQQQEANLLLDAENTDDVETVWIDAAARSRDIGRIDMAEKIREKDLEYRKKSGHLSGIRQRHIERVYLILDCGESHRLALESYDWTKYWDEEYPDYSDGAGREDNGDYLNPSELKQPESS